MLHQTISAGCDCDDPAHTQALLDIDVAIMLAMSLITPLDRTDTIALNAANSRICAENILSKQAMPVFDNSAMDGFALRAEDLATRLTLPICGCVAAGEAPPPLPRGTAMRIYTGAPLPTGADAVIKIEDSQPDGSHVHFSGAKPRTGQNIRRKGSDQGAGTSLLRKGQRIASHHIGLLAAHGHISVTVSARPRVAIISTGNELCEGTDNRARIFDANRPMLLSMATSFGADVTDLGIVQDNLDATTAILDGASGDFDLILTSGAVSIGGKDIMRAAVEHAGGQIDGWRVAIKPGKPVMFGQLKGTVITGLPGNPFAAFTGFHLFAAAQIAKLMGCDPTPAFSVPAEADFAWSRKPGRAEVFSVRLQGYAPNGLPLLERLGNSVSATLWPLSNADGIAMVSQQTADIQPGDRLTWHPFQTSGVLQ